MLPIALIDYGSGNLHSAAKALEQVAGKRRVLVTSNPQDVLAAGHIVLPGVGAFADCMQGLQAQDGLIPALQQAVRQQGKPFLGICVGMQLLATAGHEHGVTKGLGWIAGDVVKLESAPALKIPHIGWNTLVFKDDQHDARHPVLRGLQGHMYFVHSYHFQVQHAADCWATTDYGQLVTAIVGRDTMIGTQFHPEKSQQMGLRFLQQFVEWQP